MPNFLVSLIRTYVPIGVGFLVTYLAGVGVVIPEDASNGLILFVGALATALYYLIARAIEKALPGLGRILVGLGAGTEPKYTEPQAVRPLRDRSGPVPGR